MPTWMCIVAPNRQRDRGRDAPVGNAAMNTLNGIKAAIVMTFGLSIAFNPGLTAGQGVRGLLSSPLALAQYFRSLRL
jgi:hypothetical protein